MKKSLIVLSITLSTLSFAKVSVFSNQDVAIHILKSRQLAALKLKDSNLKNLDLKSLSIKRSGAFALGATYDSTLTYSANGPMLTVCSVNARVVNQKVPAPSGITATKLSAPSFSEVKCVF